MQRAVFPLFLALALVFAVPSLGGDPAPFADFTFKRLSIPTPGSGRLILVQIDPDAKQEREIAPAPEPEVPQAPLGKDYSWFWDAVSPGLASASSGRLEAAVSQLRNGPGGTALNAPRLQALQDIAQAHGANILAATVGTKVSPALVLAVIAIESSGRADAVSPAGAAGLMQLIPATAQRFGVADRLEPSENIRGGVAYLDWLMNAFDRDPVLVLAAYNAGENAVRRHEGVPPFTETRAYVPRVLAAWMVARGLCITPPELVSDGCVFAVQQARAHEAGTDE